MLLCAENANVNVSAAWVDATVDDHQQTQLVVTIDRSVTCNAVSGLGYTITLPGAGTLWRASGTDVSTCDTTGITTGVGNPVLDVTGVAMAIGVGSCTITFPVLASASGTYQLTAADFTSVSGVSAAGQTTQTLTVTTAKARVSAKPSPSSIIAMETSTLMMQMTRTDANAAAVSSGLGFRLNLPADVFVASGTPTNECGGTLTATVGAAYLTLAGASLTGAPAACGMSVPITSAVSGKYGFKNSLVTDTSGVNGAMTGCTEQVRAEGECQPSLYVDPKPQTITFPAPPNWSVSKHTAPLAASAESGLPVAFTSSTPLVCTVAGSTVTLVSEGSCMLAADQEGNGTWDVAPTVSGTFTVGPPIPSPGLVTAVGGVSSLTATWMPPGDVTGVTGYTAIANPGPATCSTKSAAVTTCVMGGTAGVVYTITVITNHPLGDSAAAEPSNEATPTAPVIPPTPPDTDLTLTTDKGLITTAEPGQDIVVIGTGFMPYSTATIVVYSTPIELGTVVTDGDGNFSKPVRVPPDLVVGGHSLVAAGVGPNGQPHSLKMAITVEAQRTHGLAVTGAPIAAMLQLGLAMAFGGGTLLLAGHRRRRA